MEEQVITKTVEDWLNDLEEPYRSQAIKNVTELNDDAFNDVLVYKADRMTRALSASFIWEDSPEGHEYWYDVYSNYLEI